MWSKRLWICYERSQKYIQAALTLSVSIGHIIRLHVCNSNKYIALFIFIENFLLHSSNLLSIVHMEANLGIYACVFNRFHDDHQQNTASGITSSLLKRTNGSTHGDETWYVCAFNCFHD